MAGVDIAGQSELYSLLAQVRNRHNCGIMLVSHDLHLVMSGTDRVIASTAHLLLRHPQGSRNESGICQGVRGGFIQMAVRLLPHA